MVIDISTGTMRRDESREKTKRWSGKAPALYGIGKPFPGIGRLY